MTEGAPPAPPPATVRRVRTFQDVAAAKNLTKDSNDQERIVLSQSNWLPPPIVIPSHVPSQGGPGALKHPPPMSGPLQTPPMDWSLKRCVKFLSDQPFLLHKQATAASRRDVLLAERCFVSGGLLPLKLTTGSASQLSPQVQQLIAACMSWQFPQDCLKTPEGAGGVLEAIARRSSWQESLCSLYDAFRNGECPFFYITYRSAPGGDAHLLEKRGDYKGRPLCTVFFGASGINGRKRVHALMTRSTVGLRTLFKQQGIGFEMPLMIGGSNKENFPQKANQGITSNGGEGTRSLLIFNGVLQVHALFDFILNRGVSNAAGLFGDGDSDLPLLLSPVHFTNASLHKYHLECIETKWNHQLEVKGNGAPIPPWVVDRIFCVLCNANDDGGGDSNGRTITLMCDSRTDTGALNWYDDDGNSSTEEQSHNRTAAIETISQNDNSFFACAKEHVRWKRCCAGLNTVALREIKFSDGAYTIAKTTEKVAPT